MTYRRQKILCDERVRKALREGIKATQLTNPFTIDAWVLLPDHLHTIWTLPPDDANFGIRWALIKRFDNYSPHKINKKKLDRFLVVKNHNCATRI